LIDDAISALDSEVGNKIMKNVFCGILKDKTRVMITHKSKLLQKMDRVILMRDMKII